MACDSSDTAGDLELIDTDLPVFVMQIVLLISKLQCICIRKPKSRNSSKYDKYCRKQTTFLKDMFRHAYAIISLMSS